MDSYVVWQAMPYGKIITYGSLCRRDIALCPRDMHTQSYISNSNRDDPVAFTRITDQAESDRGTCKLQLQKIPKDYRLTNTSAYH